MKKKNVKLGRKGHQHGTQGKKGCVLLLPSQQTDNYFRINHLTH